MSVPVSLTLTPSHPTPSLTHTLIFLCDESGHEVKLDAGCDSQVVHNLRAVVSSTLAPASKGLVCSLHGVSHVLAVALANVCKHLSLGVADGAGVRGVGPLLRAPARRRAEVRCSLFCGRGGARAARLAARSGAAGHCYVPPRRAVPHPARVAVPAKSQRRRQHGPRPSC